MQKWIRDRMRRRNKKKTQPESGAAAQSPLQPAYPEPLQPSDGIDDVTEPAIPAQPAETEASAPAATPVPTPARSRRRRKKKPAQAEQPQPELTETQPVMREETPGHTPTAVGSIVQDAPATREPESQSRPALEKSHRTTKGALVLAVGLPGSGKTTWYKRRGVTPLSSDAVRQILFDDSTEQHHQDLVFGTLRSLLRARLIARMPMNYVDATNLSPKERRHWIKMARDFGYEVQAVYFDVPLEVCMERNRRRNRVVPEDVMHRMAAKLKPPTFDEGFSKIVVVRVKSHPTESNTAQRPGEHEGGAETE